MTAATPIVAVGRVLLPGARMTVSLPPEKVGTLADPAVDEVVVFYQADEESRNRSGVGTMAQVTGRRLTDDGVLMLRVEGRNRVTIAPGVATSEASDQVGDRSRARVAQRSAVGALRRYLAALAEHGRTVDIHVSVPQDPVAGSYQVASLLELSAPELQALLAAPTAEERFEMLERVLQRETALLRATY